ncbi:MAG: DUF2934 domain-containing protein [Dissulfurispiraceae bacterium]
MDIHSQIENLAYELYENSGRVEGSDLDHWLEAEHLILCRHQAHPGSVTETA